jgi:hypothetical protein
MAVRSALRAGRSLHPWYSFLLEANRWKRGIALLATCFMPLSCLACSLNLMMEATCSSQTSLYFQRTTLRYELYSP